MQNLVTVSAGQGGTKVHTITDEGRAFLDANRSMTDALLARMAEFGREQGGEPPPQVIRAMENLKLALRLRLGQGRLTEDQANSVAVALDAAAIGVERA